jgi:GYF domain 2
MAAQDDAIWHVLVDNVQRGPLRRSQVLTGLRDGTFGGDTLIWRPGFENWLPLREVREFWTPPSGPERQPEAERPPTPDQADGPKKQFDEKWSLWGAATVGLVISSASLCLRALTTESYKLASTGHAPSGGQVGELIGELISIPLLFVLIAVIRNTVRRRSLRPSSASAGRRAAIFFGNHDRGWGLTQDFRHPILLQRRDHSWRCPRRLRQLLPGLLSHAARCSRQHQCDRHADRQLLQLPCQLPCLNPNLQAAGRGQPRQLEAGCDNCRSIVPSWAVARIDAAIHHRFDVVRDLDQLPRGDIGVGERARCDEFHAAILHAPSAADSTADINAISAMGQSCRERP